MKGIAWPATSRVLLKLSGEALKGESLGIFDHDRVERFAREIISGLEDGRQIAVVVGGGNIWRGRDAVGLGMDAVMADQSGMLATVINALTLRSIFKKLGQETRVMSSIQMNEVAEPYIYQRAIRHLEKGRVVVLAAGLGRPHFTTDTAAVHRAIEIDAQVVLKATGVDGVFDGDPLEDDGAKKIPYITHSEFVAQGLGVLDTTAVTLARDRNLPVVVFDSGPEGSIGQALRGQRIGSLISTPR